MINKIHITYFRVIFISVILLMAFVSTANDSVLHTKVYKIGLPQVPGLMSRTEDGMVHGFPLEIFEHVANDENIQFEWVEGSWDYLFKMILNGEIDALPATQVTNERKKALDFLDNTLYTMWSELYIANDSEFENLSDLTGKKIGLVKGDNNAKGFEKYIEGFELKYTKIIIGSHIQGLEQLQNNEVYALVAPSFYLKSGTNKKIKKAGLYFNPTNLNISFPKGKNIELQKAIDNRLLLYKKDPNSIYNQLFVKYGLSSYNEPSYTAPQWIKLVSIIVIISIFVVVVFLFLLRNQVKRKTIHLKQGDVYLRRTMELGNMGSWEIDVSKWEVEFSKELFEILGYKEQVKLSFSYLREIIYPDDKLRATQILFESIKLGNNFDIEFRLIKSDGSLIYTRQIGVVYCDEKGMVTKILGLIQNINEQKNYELELVKAKEKAEEGERLKSAFLANMSHEIRTPLNAIVGFSSLIGRENLSPEKRTNFYDIIQQQNDLLLNLINDIIDFSKIESRSLILRFTDDVDLDIMLKGIHETFMQHCPSTIKFKYAENKFGGNYFIKTDVVRLNQILNNLIINAFKYTKEGEIEIGFSSNSITNNLEIFVRDTGIGVPSEHQYRIFERFHQVDTMSQGTGLGLAICKSLAKMLGGNIEIKSSINEGSEFIIELPLSIVRRTDDELYKTSLVDQEVDIKSVNLRGCKILVAEDDSSNFLFINTVLGEKEVETVWAKNGLEAVDKAKEQDFDMVLMDIKMPRMDGLTATQNIKNFKPDLPIIAITAFAFDSDRSKAIEAGCSDYISKPINREELIESITTQLKKI